MNPSTAPQHSHSLWSREQRHRRGLLLAIAALLVLGTSPVFGHHLVTSVSESLIGRDHLLSICLVALHALLSPVHLLFHLLLAAGAVYGIIDRSRAVWYARGTLGRLAGRRPQAGDWCDDAAAIAGVARGGIRIVDDLPVPAFTAGWLRPRIYLSAELRDALTGDELAAVLAHEQSHVVRRDPLRLFTMRFLACLLFFIPALRRLADDLADEAEIVADDAAVARPGVRPLALASAILALASYRGVDQRTAVVVGFHRDELIERRIRRLAGEQPGIGTRVTRRSLFGAGSLLVAVWTSGLIMAHPLPAQASVGAPGHAGHAAHCQHHGYWAFTHLFCGGVSAGPCPHAGR